MFEVGVEVGVESQDGVDVLACKNIVQIDICKKAL